MIPFGKALCFWLQIRPWINQLWPPEGDNGVTNMDVVFFSDLEDERIAPPRRKPGETWVQKGHPFCVGPNNGYRKTSAAMCEFLKFDFGIISG
jgi:hypothetical protein